MDAAIHLYKSVLLLVGVHFGLSFLLADTSLCGHDVCCSNYIFQEGRCIECPPGTYGVNCSEECPQGYYGRLCKNECPSQCDQTCDILSGDCPECTPGTYGINCSEVCPHGFYGRLCENECPVQCNETCDKVSGECQGLAAEEKPCECASLGRSTNKDDLTLQKLQLEIEYLHLKIKKLKRGN